MRLELRFGLRLVLELRFGLRLVLVLVSVLVLVLVLVSEVPRGAETPKWREAGQIPPRQARDAPPPASPSDESAAPPARGV